jgi:two-component system NtrC family sensor kinase
MRSLRAILLVNLGFLTAAALLLVGVLAVAASAFGGGDALWVVLAYVLGATGVFLGFGTWLVRRMIIEPLHTLAQTADALADGAGPVPPSAFEGREFHELDGRFRAMAQRLLDAQGQVVRAEKLAAIGRLGAGLAHEIRNPLGALNTYVEVLKQRGAATEVVEAMQHEVGRMDRIVAGLLDYARPRAAERRRVDLAAMAKNTVEFLSRQGALKGHPIEMVCDPLALPVLADPHDLEQMLVNLILNARDASPSSRIVIGVHPHQPGAPRRHEDETDRASRPRRGPAPPPPRPSGPVDGNATLLLVADEGPGVAEADRERVFDPFFTTKEPGEGTGLGLAIVARAAHDAGGVVWVDRAREGGAVFKVLLPAVEGSR